VPAPLSQQSQENEVLLCCDLKKMTVKAQEAVQSAQEVAARQENQQI